MLFFSPWHRPCSMYGTEVRSIVLCNTFFEHFIVNEKSLDLFHE